MYRLIYTSRSRLPDAEADAVVAGIVEVSRHRNAREDITGALMFTGGTFAQILEGEADAVRRLMADIRRDRAHADIEVAHEGDVPARAFADWSMGYWGRSRYVAGLVEAVRAGGGALERRAALNLLTRFMTESARTGLPVGG